MKTRSAKAKGKRLEKWVLGKILETFPTLTNEDARITIGVETGADIKLSAKAREIFCYSVECKNREVFNTLYSYYTQALKNSTGEQAIVFIKMNDKLPMAIMDAGHFFTLLKGKV